MVAVAPLAEGAGKRLSALLVIGEMALAVVLLAGAGVMLRSFLNIYTADLGVKTANVFTMLLKLPDAKYPSLEAHFFFDRLMARLEAIPSVESIAMAIPFRRYSTGASRTNLLALPPLVICKRVAPPKAFSGGHQPVLLQNTGSGRAFRPGVSMTPIEFSAIPVVIVNQRFASKFWPGEDPLGKRFRLFDGKCRSVADRRRCRVKYRSVWPHSARV